MIIEEAYLFHKIDIYHPCIAKVTCKNPEKQLAGAGKLELILYTGSKMNAKTGGFEEVAHTADLEIKVWGKDLRSLFTSAAEGMFHLLGIEGYEQGLSAVREEISLNAMDYEGLLILFLEELLYRLTEEYMRFSIDNLSLDDKFSLQAKLRGSQIKSYQRDIKAVTYHKLNIREVDKGYTVNIVFDI